jgi:poly-gamma-glutamate synthesis protein (capsule biosynthesis protein)
LKIALLGDMAFYGKYSTSNLHIKDYFLDAKRILENYDYVIGNLETPFCNSCEPFGYKSAHIFADEENVELLKYLNVNIVNLANNHIFDCGLEGYRSTKKILDKNFIEYFGIENRQIKIENNNSKIALGGYCCYSTNGLGYYKPRTGIGVNILDAKSVEKQLVQNENEGYFNIVSIHAGQEHVNYPNYDHLQLARKLAMKTHYVYYGHHPHVIQGIEEVNGSLLAYSLGNFCFDDVYTEKSSLPLIKQEEQNKKSFILSLEINQNEVIKYECIPIFLGESKVEVGENQTIVRDINIYSNYLNLEKDMFINERNKELNNYVSKRKKKRNLEWYLKRLNLKSVLLVFNAIKNKRNYKKAILDYVQESCQD